MQVTAELVVNSQLLDLNEKDLAKAASELCWWLNQFLPQRGSPVVSFYIYLFWI